MKARAMGDLLSAGAPAAQSFAADKVWKNSARGRVRFIPLGSNRSESKRIAARLWHNARRFERQTRGYALVGRSRGGKACVSRQDGRIGRNGLAILQAFLFDFLNPTTGQLDPSYETIARAANISVRSVARGLQRLKAAGLLWWERRCSGAVVDGRYELHQESNAYAVLRETSWAGFKAPPEAPPPDPDAWGATPPIAPAIERHAELHRAGDRIQAQRALEDDPGDGLAAAIGRLNRSRSRNP